MARRRTKPVERTATMNVLTARGILRMACVALTTAAFLGLALALQPARSQTQQPQKRLPAKTKPHRTDWLHQAKWGVMFHYCSNWFKMGKNWDKTIKDFNVKGLAKQLDSVGAGYLLITAKHCGHPIAPNAAYEKVMPGKCPKRDLIADLADELGKYDIKLMLYYATGMGLEGGKTASFTAEVIEEFSKRYGAKVKGWWLDNNVGKKDLQKLLADACRAGNKESLVAFSPPKTPRRNSPQEDYSAGNTHAPGYAKCTGRWVSGLQWHMLTYLGHNWGGYCRKRTGSSPIGKVVGFARKITGRGGAITWDTPYETSGLIRANFMPYLKAIGEATGTIKAGTKKKKKSVDK